MGKAKVVSIDDRIKPPAPIRMKTKVQFTQLVKDYPSDYFLQSDAYLIMQYCVLLQTLQDLQTELNCVEAYITINDFGTEGISGAAKAFDMVLRQTSLLGDRLRITPSARTGAVPTQDLPASHPRRLLFNFHKTAEQIAQQVG